MSVTAAAWALLAGGLAVGSVARPAWAVALYFLTFFAAPHLWWWGRDLPSLRYALLAGFVLLVSAAVHAAGSARGLEGRSMANRVAIAMAVNGTLVHFILASDPAISFENYVELLKFILLFFLLRSAIHDRADFRLVLMAVALGAGYIGYEVTINERGDFNGSRLEGVGAPGADSANSLAALMLVSIPLAGSLFIHGRKWEKLVAVVTAPLALNVLLLCNSRGAFLGLIGGAASFVLVARGRTRKKALRTALLGGIVLFALLGDPEIMERFLTTFTGSEDRDRSAASRIEYWQAGLRMVADYPLGAGGGAFKYVHAPRYLAELGSDDDARSLHNGYLTEATDWGIQGLALKLLLIGSAIAAAYRTTNRCRLEGRLDDALMGMCMLVAASGFLIHCMFGSFLGNEWAFWICAFLVRYSELYRVGVPSTVTETVQPRLGAPNVVVGA